ncbi:AAA family ATPase [Archangium violaceum]|uniref:AAA family ATPase n=1 Tax=Archangium violaceum TaxID=83451 RepID=UPI002B2B0FE3|nr:AAA family ATPase [Archangium violaceum]
MYIKELRVRNLKLLRDPVVPFTHSDGSARQWTVFVGENGLCKTSLLHAVAMAASGATRSNQLANVPSLRDKRHPGELLEVEARFGFSTEFHAAREYPGLENKPQVPPDLVSTVGLPPDFSQLVGGSTFVEAGTERPLPVDLKWELDPLSVARARNLPHWFVVGYGVGRRLPVPQSHREELDPAQDRLRSLFDATHTIVGTDFISRFDDPRAREYARRLREALIEFGILPRMGDLELRGRGGVTSPAVLLESHRFEQIFSRGKLKIPAVWLSHGYQSTISWIADLIGQVLQEARSTNVPLDQMEGIVLIDELDLHLHPRWQQTLIETLRNAFKRLQFIATTHSPMVLPGLRHDEIFIMRQNDEGDVHAEQASQSARLMTGSELYRSFFDITTVYPNELGQKLRDYGYLAGNPFRTDAEDSRMRQLLADLHSEGIEPEWSPVPRQTLPGNDPMPPSGAAS